MIPNGAGRPARCKSEQCNNKAKWVNGKMFTFEPWMVPETWQQILVSMEPPYTLTNDQVRGSICMQLHLQNTQVRADVKTFSLRTGKRILVTRSTTVEDHVICEISCGLSSSSSDLVTTSTPPATPEPSPPETTTTAAAAAPKTTDVLRTRKGLIICEKVRCVFAVCWAWPKRS